MTRFGKVIAIGIAMLTMLLLGGVANAAAISPGGLAAATAAVEINPLVAPVHYRSRRRHYRRHYRRGPRFRFYTRFYKRPWYYRRARWRRRCFNHRRAVYYSHRCHRIRRAYYYRYY